MVSMITRGGVGRPAEDPPGRLQAVQLGHPDVHQHHVGPGAPDRRRPPRRRRRLGRPRRCRPRSGSSGSRPGPAPGRRRPRTRGGAFTRPCQGDPGVHPVAAGQPRPGRAGCRRRRRAAPAARSGRARRGRPAPAGRRARPPVSVDLHPQLGPRRTRRAPTAWRPGRVLDGVGQRLLDHPVGGQLDPGRAPAAGAPAMASSTGSPAPRPGRPARPAGPGPAAGPARGAAGPAGASGVSRPITCRSSAIAARPPASTASSACSGLLRLGGHHLPGRAGLDHHHADVVGHHVVQLAGDPGPLVLGRPAQRLDLLVLQRGDPLPALVGPAFAAGAARRAATAIGTRIRTRDRAGRDRRQRLGMQLGVQQRGRDQARPAPAAGTGCRRPRCRRRSRR